MTLKRAKKSNAGGADEPRSGSLGPDLHAVATLRPVATNEPPEDDSVVESGVSVKAKPKTKRPSMYKVLLLNDDYTPMEFVVHVLERFFAMPHERAVELMLTVHTQGVAIVGVFTYEVAETKVTQVMDYARQNQHPLQCAMEKE